MLPSYFLVLAASRTIHHKAMAFVRSSDNASFFASFKPALLPGDDGWDGPVCRFRYPRDGRGRISTQMLFKVLYESLSLQKIKLTLQ